MNKLINKFIDCLQLILNMDEKQRETGLGFSFL